MAMQPDDGGSKTVRNPQVVRTWDDLLDRLHRADARLTEMAGNQAVGLIEGARLRGKIEGVRLALSYMRDYRDV